jgi:hypothetical protein
MYILFQEEKNFCAYEGNSSTPKHVELKVLCRRLILHDLFSVLLKNICVTFALCYSFLSKNNATNDYEIAKQQLWGQIACTSLRRV